MTEPERKLDGVTTSMDVLALNNLVVSFRPLVQKVKVHVVTKLSKQIKQCKTRHCKEDQKVTYLNKAERMTQEIMALKKLNIDHITKYCLANTLTVEEAAKTDDKEKKVLTRIATHNLMVAKVKAWRDAHEDWKALVAFVLSKNTGRRIKNKTKKKSKQAAESEEINMSSELIKIPQLHAAESAGSDLVEDGYNADTSNALVTDSACAKTQKRAMESDEDEEKPKKKARQEEDNAAGSESASESASESESDEDEDDGNSGQRSDNKEEDDLMNRLISGLKNGPAQSAGINSSDDELDELDLAHHESSRKQLKDSDDESEAHSIEMKKATPKTEILPMEQTGEETHESPKKKTNREKKLAKKKYKNDLLEMKQTEVDARHIADTSEMVVTQFNMSEIPDDVKTIQISKPSNKNDLKVDDKSTVEKAKKKRDTFFMRGPGDEESSEEEEEDVEEVEEVEEAYNEMPTRRFDNHRGASQHSNTAGGASNYKSGKFEKWEKPSFKTRPGGGHGKKFGGQTNKKTYEPIVPAKTEALHPSWEASRKRKEQQNNIPAFTGKKITFDD